MSAHEDEFERRQGIILGIHTVDGSDGDHGKAKSVFESHFRSGIFTGTHPGFDTPYYPFVAVIDLKTMVPSYIPSDVYTGEFPSVNRVVKAVRQLSQEP